MAATKKKSRKKSSPPSSSRRWLERLGILWSGRELPARGLALGGVFALGCLVVIWGSLEIRSRVRGDDRMHVEGWGLVLRDLPPWVTPEIASDLESVNLVHPERAVNVLDRDATASVRERLEASPWVRTVKELELRYPSRDERGEIAATLWLRKPVAIVPHDGLYYLADSEARRLGGGYRESPNLWFGVPTIVGLRDTGALPAVGETWASQDLRQGIEVARILDDAALGDEYPGRPINAIDLSNLHGRLEPRQSEIYLWCGSQKLAWGRSPLSAGARTVTVEELLANLRHVLAHPEHYGDYAVIHLHRKWEHVTGLRG